MPGDNAAMDVELIAECDGGEAAVCDPPGRQDRGRRRGGVDHGVRQDHKRLGYTETPLIPARKRAYAGNPGGPGSPPSRGRTELGTFAGYCMIALPPVSVFRLAMVLPFMHLQPCGGPRGRRKRFRRSVAQWLEHRSPNSEVAGLVHAISGQMSPICRHFCGPECQSMPSQIIPCYRIG